jgi:hypothetical protein
MILELEKSWKSHWMVSQHYEPFKKLVQIQTAIDPARTKKFDDKLMRINRCFLIHEVGIL